MQATWDTSTWDFAPVINLLHALSPCDRSAFTSPTPVISTPASKIHRDDNERAWPEEDKDVKLGDFDRIFDLLGQPLSANEDPSLQSSDDSARDNLNFAAGDVLLGKGVRWRDEVDGADLEDNAEPGLVISAASLRTVKRAARRARAKQRQDLLGQKGEQQALQEGLSDAVTDGESETDVQSGLRSPDRRAIIHEILHGSMQPDHHGNSAPQTSSTLSPERPLSTPKKEWPISQPQLWQGGPYSLYTSNPQIVPRLSLTPAERRAKLISMLLERHRSESKYLVNPGLQHPAFCSSNVLDIGVHVFVDISNIMIGFHDCLKLARDIPITARVRRVPLSFHNFSIVLERGRPVAKRVLVGSDKYPTIEEAKTIGYETNILERVHKAKELTPRQKKFQGNSGASSGSETNAIFAPQKWVEQAVDEILHLKILESLVDAAKPSTVVLATGDAAEAEYSGGFLRMVERALEKGWMVELVSFKLNTSGAYKSRDFRSKWGPMFKWIQLDDYAEELLDL